MAGREHIIDAITLAFDRGSGDPNLSTIFVGARGTGKTALLAYLSEKALAHGWVSANVSAVDGMLEDIIERSIESASELIDVRDGARVKGVSVGGVLGIEWEYRDPQSGNWRTRMNSLIKELEAHGTGLLITVDEVRADLDEMVQLVSVYQHFVREGKKVALLMAGLPYKVSSLLTDQSISFLRRAQCHYLERIPDYEIENALRKTIENPGRSIEAEALSLSVDAIGGFPYMMQLVGYRMWDVQPDEPCITQEDAAKGIRLASREMKSRIIETTYRELSNGDLRFLKAMLPDEKESRLSDIAQRMGKKSNYASQYKRRLLEEGVIGERARGVVGFDIPGFREYLTGESD
ncbi:ATP-binding protein [Raoultibacter phocaeensis]|uniref:ATP-binding protein n=1 Tax=Raoultibacter phocaeensis TaxID=2479841 RepID=UPI002105B183|nr:ATP-binding protein [Raoultibacter phocaeensis]